MVLWTACSTSSVLMTCFLYPQYDYSAKIGPNSRVVKAKPDFGILSETDKIMLVIEDRTVTSASYSNNWKEDQVMGELFAAVHHVVTKSRTLVVYPVTVHAVRVIGTKFTFYRTIATLEYIKESAKLGLSIDNEMAVQRCPLVEDNPSHLTAYNICDKDDRLRILECLCAIRRSICWLLLLLVENLGERLRQIFRFRGLCSSVRGGGIMFSDV